MKNNKKHNVKIVVFHVFYLIIFLIFSLLFYQGGHGSFVPVAVFFGPFSIPFFLLNPQELTGYFLCYFLQMPLYGFVWWIFYKKNLNYRFLFILPIFHFSGTLISLFLIKNKMGDTDGFITWLLISSLIILPYWIKYFSLGKQKDLKIKSKK